MSSWYGQNFNRIDWLGSIAAAGLLLGGVWGVVELALARTTAELRLEMSEKIGPVSAKMDTLQSAFDRLGEDLGQRIDGGLANREDAMARLVAAYLGQANGYTMSALNVPVGGEDWGRVMRIADQFGGQVRFGSLRGMGLVEVDFDAIDDPQFVAMQQALDMVGGSVHIVFREAGMLTSTAPDGRSLEEIERLIGEGAPLTVDPQ